MSVSRSSHDLPHDERMCGGSAAHRWEVAEPAPTDPGPARDAGDGEWTLVASLRQGDEAAFETLIVSYHMSLVRLARVWIRDASVAEEVAQETWMAVLQGIHAFQGRSPLRTWIISILANKAKRRASRESRSRPFSTFDTIADHDDSPDLGPEHFFPPGHEWAGHWTYPLADEETCPERHLLAQEMGGFLLEKIEELPGPYRSVILLRDLHGLTTEETCHMLGISAGNQRVILHRARTRLRAALAPYLKDNDHVARHA